MRLIVLGSTGMLGTEVVRVAHKSSSLVVGVSRTEGVFFDAEQMRFSELAQNLSISDEDCVINCIGWIPQKSSGDSGIDNRQAQLLNVELASQINESAKDLGFKWIQIGTDCVFDGEEGSYSESTPKNADDLYGLSKIQGEKLSPMAMIIRASIIGPDRRTKAGLYAWFLGQVRTGRTVSGFQNHLWNGVSTTAFARLALGLANANKVSPLTAHWIPKDVVSKFSLLRLFADRHGYSPDAVQPAMGAVGVNRTLTTIDASRNEEFWQIAGYTDVPSIEQLVAELVLEDMNQES
jgi:dTDP-4-dehydrorhamnose reductase